MIVLRSEDLLVRIDPRHGAEILDLVELKGGRQLLGRPPFGSTDRVAGDLDERTWTEAYRGGWQLLAPNAGAASTRDGVAHGFHGRASNDPWEVLSAETQSASFRWEGHGLSLRRRVALEDGALRVELEARALEGPAPLVAVEHLAVGLELLEPEVEIELPAAPAFEMSESRGPVQPPASAPDWPSVLLLDGTTERADRWALADERSRLLCLADLPDGRAVVRNPARGLSLELSWETDWLRHLWVWHEVRTYDGPYRGRAEMLVIEPSSVPHHLGLAAAVERGQARVLEAGEACGYQLVARVTHLEQS
jgi:hypothetical protein